MSKRFVTTLLALITCIVCAFSFSACGGENGVKLSKGVEVTEEEWKAAFSATRLASNVTFSTVLHHENTFSDDGTTETTLTEEKNDYKFDGEKVHYYTTYLSTTNGEIYNNTEFEHYGLVKDNYYWSAIHRYDSDKEFVGTADTDWSVSKNLHRFENAEIEHYAGMLISFAFEDYSLEYGGEEFSLDDLYEQFTFNDGFYVAELYTAILYNYNKKNKISVAIKDGFIIGIRLESGVMKNEFFSGEGYYSCAMKNYGKTSVTFPKDVQKAFDYALDNPEN